MPPKRISSKVKNRQLETKALEDQTKKMEEKLSLLRQQVEEQKKLKQANPQQSTINRWRKATGSNVPLRDYAKKVLNDRKEAFNKYGLDEKKILGSKSFEPVLTKIKCERMEAEGKNPTRLPIIQTSQNQNSPSQIYPNNTNEGTLPVQSLASNFFKARMSNTEMIKRKSLEEFLEEHYLLEYLGVLKDNGINQIDDLYHISREKLGQLGIKSGHQVKLIKRVKEEIDNGSPNKKGQEEKKVQQIKQKVSFGYGDGDINEYKQIAKKEEEQKIRKIDNNQDIKKNTQYSEQMDEYEEESNEDEEQYADQVLITVPFAQQTADSAENQQHSLSNQGFVCFQCYRRSFAAGTTSSDGRQFCSESCLLSYLKLMQKECPECKETFYKFEGMYEQGLWFCSLKCSPNREDIEQMFLNWRKNGSNEQ